jgi:hypothetical protein
LVIGLIVLIPQNFAPNNPIISFVFLLQLPPSLDLLRFSRPKIDPQRAEAPRARRLGSPVKDICSPGDLETDKTGGHNRGL